MTDRADATGGSDAEASPAVDLAWLDALRDVGARGAHALRNRLNAVAVNLEVVRSRVARGGAETGAVSRFADVASSQLEAASEASSALLSLLCPETAPLDVQALVARVARVLPSITVAAPAGSVGARTTVTPDVARVIVVRALLDAVAIADHIECAITGTDDIFLDVRISPAGTEQRALHLDPRVAQLASRHGVEVRSGDGAAPGAALRLVFPVVTGGP